MLNEAIHWLQELKVFDSFKNQIKNELHTPSQEATIQARFQKVSAPLKLLFSLQAAAPSLLAGFCHIYEQIVASVLDFESVPLEYYEKVGFFYKVAIPAGYMLDTA